MKRLFPYLINYIYITITIFEEYKRNNGLYNEKKNTKVIKITNEGVFPHFYINHNHVENANFICICRCELKKKIIS